MQQEYTIIIKAKNAHQPSSDEILEAVCKLVRNRTAQFPKKSGTEVEIIPKRRVQK